MEVSRLKSTPKKTSSASTVSAGGGEKNLAACRPIVVDKLNVLAASPLGRASVCTAVRQPEHGKKHQ